MGAVQNYTQNMVSKVRVAEMMRSARTIDLGVLPDDQVEAPSHES